MTISKPDMWENILSLMAAIVLSDDRVRDEEIQSFIANTRVMAREIDPNTVINEADLIAWFSLRRAPLAAQMSGKNRDPFIIKTIMALEPFYHKVVLMKALTSISAADDDMHPSELEILNLAAGYWDLPLIRGRRLRRE